MSLPTELYARIFENLHLRLISKYFDEINKRYRYTERVYIPLLNDNKISDNIVNLQIGSSIMGLKMINNLINIRTLSLTLCKNITDADIFHFRKFKYLENINLSSTKITDTGVNSLQRIKKLRILDLSSTCITDHSMIYIAAMKNLQELDISYTDITTEGIKCLQKNRSLLKLVLYNIIDNDSTDNFHRITKLRSLAITPYSSDIAFDQLINLNELILDDISLDQNILNRIRRLTKLKKLVLSCEDFNSNTIFDLTLPELEELKININSTTDYKIHLVPDGIHNIKVLEIDQCEINENDMKSLIKCRKLKKLVINDTFNEVPRLNLLKELTRLKNFTTFDYLTEDKISKICDINSIEELHIEKMYDEGMKHLQRLKRLRKIFFWVNDDITDVGLSFLKDCKNLEEFKISNNDNITNQGLSHLVELKNLRKITLYKCSKIKFDELNFNDSIKIINSLY